MNEEQSKQELEKHKQIEQLGIKINELKEVIRQKKELELEIEMEAWKEIKVKERVKELERQKKAITRINIEVKAIEIVGWAILTRAGRFVTAWIFVIGYLTWKSLFGENNV